MNALSALAGLLLGAAAWLATSRALVEPRVARAAVAPALAVALAAALLLPPAAAGAAALAVAAVAVRLARPGLVGAAAGMALSLGALPVSPPLGLVALALAPLGSPPLLLLAAAALALVGGVALFALGPLALAWAAAAFALALVAARWLPPTGRPPTRDAARHLVRWGAVAGVLVLLLLEERLDLAPPDDILRALALGVAGALVGAAGGAALAGAATLLAARGEGRALVVASLAAGAVLGLGVAPEAAWAAAPGLVASTSVGLVKAAVTRLPRNGGILGGPMWRRGRG